MPESATVIESDEQVWFNADDAAKYCQRKGLKRLTGHSIKHATYKLKALPRPRTDLGESAVWHKDWLDKWMADKSKPEQEQSNPRSENADT